MKRIFVVALATLTLSTLTTLHAQQSTTPAAQPAAATAKPKGDPVEKNTKRLKKQLTLTDAQTAQVKDLLTQEHADLQKLGKSATKEQKLELNNQYREKINALLTPDQQKIYAANAEKAKQKTKEKKAAR
jgi:Spy/CpxP family protein refolding chaperone